MHTQSTQAATHLEAHDVSEQHQVTRIDTETVRVHGVLDLVDDGLARRLDTEHLFDLHDVVRRRLPPDDTVRDHDLAQTLALDEEVLARRRLLNDGSLQARDTL